jgi:hypothetical protein
MSNRLLSLFMAFMTMGANFVSLCPASDTHAAEVHFSIVPCTAHECNRATPSHSCGQQECEHEFCNDKSLLESDLPRQNSQFTIYTDQIPVVIGDVTPPAIPIIINPPTLDRLACFLQLLTPLRI